MPEAEYSPEEHLRRSHCEHRDRPHECLGSITITPRGYTLSCTLCGSTSRQPSYPIEIHEQAERLAEVFGLRWELLSVEVQQRALAHLHDRAAQP